MKGCFLTFRILLAFPILVIWNGPPVEAQQQSRKPLVSALFVFGDSTIDPGNNNGLDTIFKANFPPYGRDFVDGRPTGRFTNGKLITDVLSGLMGLPDLLPASLDPDFTDQKLLTGASFGSAGAGLDDVTSLSINVIPLRKQVENFRHYRSQLADMIGQENATKIISEGIFAISMGTDDFINNCYTNPLTRKRYSVAQFQDLLLRCLNAFLQNVVGEGAVKIAIVGLPPFGCLPSQITLRNLKGNLKGKTCVEEFNGVARSFNRKAKALTEKMSTTFPGVQVLYVDIYDKPNDILRYPSEYGFEQVRKGCCGSGLVEASILCNELTPTCPDTSKYLFWDSVHPTTTGYNVIANDVFQQVLPLIRP